MKATLNLNGLRASVAFVVVMIFAGFFTACHELDPIDPIVTKTPTVNTISIVTLTAASVEVNAEIVDNGGEVIITSGICWVDSAVEPTIESYLVLATVKSGVYTVSVSNLKQKTAYYFRAFATNKNGTAYGKSVYFSDSSVPTPVKAVAFARPATNVTMTSATIAAVIVPNQADTKASFEYQSNASSWKKFDLFLALEGKNLKDSIKLTFDLSDLTPNTVYSFRVNVSNSAGEVVSQSSFTTCAVADMSGNTYHEIVIGDQVWLQENLQTTKYANGDPIANITDPVAWGKSTTGAYCWYNNDSELGKVYGGLYNFYVGTDKRGIIKGYHLPTQEEWRALDNYLRSNGANTGAQLKETGTAHWLDASSSNSTGFTALPNGHRHTDSESNVVFACLGEYSIFWTPTLWGPGAMVPSISRDLYLGGGVIDLTNGYALRLIKDK